MVSGGGGTVQLDWVGVPGATSYNIYRNVDATGNGGDTRLLATGVTDSEFADDGGDTPAADGVAPLPFGSLGKWQEVAEEMQFPREGVDAVVATIPSGEEDVPDRTFLFAVGGRPDATGDGYLASGERAEVLADGDLGPFAPLSYDLNTPRAFYVLITNQGQDESGFVPDDPEVPISKSPWTEPIYLFAVQGDDAHDGTANDGLIDFEACEIVTSDGDNGEWTTQHETVSPGQPAHGLGAALFFDHLFAFKGVSAEDLGDDPVVGGSAATRLEFFEDAADPAYILDDRQSTATAFTTDRAYYKMVRVNGYLWAIGGNDGSGPIAAIDRTLQ